MLFYGKGYVGEGKYNKRDDVCAYNSWKEILRRCYDDKYHKYRPTYKSCEMSEEWLNFQNFAEWYYENYYDINEQRMCIDKDILFKGNKIYSSDKCVFVPNDINVLFTKRQRKRGDYPIGVYLEKSSGKYKSQLTKDGKRINLGRYETSKDAFYAYKQFKESYIKEVADYYKPYIPAKLYNAMINYQVEITD